jgi:KGK domain
MEYDSYLQNCSDDDVISLDSNLCKFRKFKDAIQSTFSQIGNVVVESLNSQGIQGANIYHSHGSGKRYPANYEWLREGKDCEFLRVGSNGWQKGKFKIKITLEFYPDEPAIFEAESPLDDIRRAMNQNT